CHSHELIRVGRGQDQVAGADARERLLGVGGDGGEQGEPENERERSDGRHTKGLHVAPRQVVSRAPRRSHSLTRRPRAKRNIGGTPRGKARGASRVLRSVYNISGPSAPPATKGRLL